MWPIKLLVLSVLFCAACSKDGREAPRSPSSGDLPSVAVEVVKPSAVEDFFTVAGTVKSRRTTVLSSKLTGTVVAIAVNTGDQVRKGQTLVQIDSRELQAELAAANAGLEELAWAAKAADSALAAAQGQRELTARTYQRYEGLLAKESVTQQEFDEVHTKYKVAQAEMMRAHENRRAIEAKEAQAKARIAHVQTLLGQAVIVAPYDGIVTEKAAELGALAYPGTPLVTVEEAGSYRLEAQVGESEIRFARQGQAVPVTIAAIREELTGSVVEIVPAADPRSRTFTVKIQLPARPALRSGLYGKARFSTGRRDVATLPKSALLARGELEGVFVLGDGDALRFRLVKIGKAYGERVEVLSGLKPGERVVIRGAERLGEGEKVKATLSIDAR